MFLNHCKSYIRSILTVALLKLHHCKIRIRIRVGVRVSVRIRIRVSVKVRIRLGNISVKGYVRYLSY